MKKIAKGLAAVLLAATLTIGMAISACAVYYDHNDYSSFTWDSSGCTTKNTTNIYRYVTASIEVHEQYTGDLVATNFGSGTGAYGTIARADNPIGNASNYNYLWSGAIYNGGHPNSGILASFTKP